MVEQSRPLISVIVPVYNVDAYLRKCLGSIEAQTYTNFECVIIDDGATDSSGDICDEFCARDPRFRVIHQQNAGLGMARNAGFENSKGDYILFVDSDDFILPETLETALGGFSSGQFDWVCFGFARVDMEGNRSISDKTKELVSISEITQTVDIATRYYLGTRDETWELAAVWNKLFPRELIKDMRFINPPGEDRHFTYRVFLKTKKANYIHKDLYIWLERPDSITHHKNVKLEWLQQFGVDVILLRETSAGDMNPFRGVSLRKLFRMMLILRFILFGSEYYDEFVQQTKQLKKEILKEYLLRPDIPLRERLSVPFLMLFPRLGRFVFYKVLGN